MEGELPEDGLAAFGDDGDDLMLALARQIVNGEETDTDDESAKQVFAQARGAEAGSEESLVDDGCKAVEPELEPVVVSVHGYGNVHHDEPAEGQRSPFSLTEFLPGNRGSSRDGTVSPSPCPSSNGR